MNNKWVFIGLGILLVIAFLVWLFIESSKPLPGEKITSDCSNFIDFSKLGDAKINDKCRVHIPIGTEVKYSTNPPTFGPHYPDWIQAGVYDSPKDDRNLVHSLEHGYVIMRYKCSEGLGKTQTASESGNPDDRNSSSPSNSEFSEICKTRKDELAKIYEKKGKHKLIVVPREKLETNFALTSWGYLDKFDEFDSARIEKFIDAHLEQGPEKTMEP